MTVVEALAKILGKSPLELEEYTDREWAELILDLMTKYHAIETALMLTCLATEGQQRIWWHLAKVDRLKLWGIKRFRSLPFKLKWLAKHNAWLPELTMEHINLIWVVFAQRVYEPLTRVITPLGLAQMIAKHNLSPRGARRLVKMMRDTMVALPDIDANEVLSLLETAMASSDTIQDTDVLGERVIVDESTGEGQNTVGDNAEQRTREVRAGSEASGATNN